MRSMGSAPSSPGSFDTTDVQSGTYAGSPATFRITIVGNAHGANGSGKARLAGSITETLAYSSGGTAFSCSTGVDPWLATGA
jgi:hypothetical protein